MKKAVIVGGGISGMTAGILLQQAGISTEIYEKNPLPGGLPTAAGMGKFAAWRMAKKYGKKLDC